LNNRGYLFFTLGQYDRALSDYNRAITLKQKSLYYKNRSDTYAKMGKTLEAEEDLKKAK
jgi:tetratricopeptide (TPR) repeat protein